MSASERRCLPESWAREVYALLVAQLDADPEQQDAFVRYMGNADNYPMEWRFGGVLSFGGKLRLNGNRDNTPYVTCYAEHETPALRKLMNIINGALSVAPEEST